MSLLSGYKSYTLINVVDTIYLWYNLFVENIFFWIFIGNMID